ncbi:hypothetical protein C8R43DRAFT_909088 [Mycena crocata]|nr:hypothetical protein C8R43DRAFT_909088 [Mycena crocata]
MGCQGAQVSEAPLKLNGLHDRSLILQTSGTGGKKKAVPYTLLPLIVGTVVESWHLRPTDVNLNIMPLFHVVGIVPPINCAQPIFSGGSTIMCAEFDATVFWALAERLNATWCVYSFHPSVDFFS